MPEMQRSSSKSVPLTKSKANRNRSFHFRYLDLCRTKNTAPLAEIKRNNKDQCTLDFFGDKLSITDWLLITESLAHDQLLQTISIRLRKCLGSVLDEIDTERKAKQFKAKPFIYTKFIFAGFMEALLTCIENNKNLQVLQLEGIPLNDTNIDAIATALSCNVNLKEVSFHRTCIYDKGCEILCNVIKYSESIEKLNLANTGITTTGAESVADMIKVQKISRYTAGWQQSLRYRQVDTNDMPGIREISLARNPQICDEGLFAIVEVLKEDVWVKSVDMENCGLTDAGANILLQCLRDNHYLKSFKVHGNPGISKPVLRDIEKSLNKDNEEGAPDRNDGRLNGIENEKDPYVVIGHLTEQVKLLAKELDQKRRLLQKAEDIIEKQNAQIMSYESEMKTSSDSGVPEGYVVVRNDSLQSIIKERNHYQKMAECEEDEEVCEMNADETSPRAEIDSANKPTNYIKQKDSKMQFMVPLPEPSVSPSDSARSTGTQLMSERQATSKIRQVKSEMKYVGSKKDQALKRKSAKSDCDYTESDMAPIETNIGDTMANTALLTQTTAMRRSVRYTTTVNKKFDFDDEISLSTHRSRISEAGSADSETLRCNELENYHQIKDYANSKSSKECGQGEGAGAKRTPRAVFFGLCDN